MNSDFCHPLARLTALTPTQLCLLFQKKNKTEERIEQKRKSLSLNCVAYIFLIQKYSLNHDHLTSVHTLKEMILLLPAAVSFQYLGVECQCTVLSLCLTQKTLGFPWQSRRKNKERRTKTLPQIWHPVVHELSWMYTKNILFI